MKRLCYILITLTLVACSEGHKSKEFVKSADVSLEETSMEVVEEGLGTAINFEMLATQKLQDYVDLLILQQQHPEFREELRLQLLRLSADTLLVPSHLTMGEAGNSEISISGLVQLGEVETVSDTVQKVTFSFKLNSETTVRVDTLKAIFTTQKVVIDGLQHTTTKVTFEEN